MPYSHPIGGYRGRSFESRLLQLRYVKVAPHCRLGRQLALLGLRPQQQQRCYCRRALLLSLPLLLRLPTCKTASYDTTEC